MAAVVFAFGTKPRLNESQAFELADVLAARRNLAAQSLAHDIRLEASFGLDAEHATRDVDPTPEELGELIEVLSEPRWPTEQPAFAHLRLEALKAQAQAAPDAS